MLNGSDGYRTRDLRLDRPKMRLCLAIEEVKHKLTAVWSSLFIEVGGGFIDILILDLVVVLLCGDDAAVAGVELTNLLISCGSNDVGDVSFTHGMEEDRPNPCKLTNTIETPTHRIRLQPFISLKIDEEP